MHQPFSYRDHWRGFRMHWLQELDDCPYHVLDWYGPQGWPAETSGGYAYGPLNAMAETPKCWDVFEKFWARRMEDGVIQ